MVRARLRAMLIAHLQLLDETEDFGADEDGTAGGVTAEAAAAGEPAGAVAGGQRPEGVTAP